MGTRQSRAEEFREFAVGRAGQLFRSASLLTGGDAHLAEDLVQETLARMYLVWGRMHRIDNPAAYAQTVLVRTFLAHRRKFSSRERPVDTVSDAESPQRAGDPALRVALLDALSRLAPRDRAVVVLRYWEDRSIAETAAVLHVSSAAVRTRANRALARLREQLGSSITELAA
ncbi:SigE family RNA polymerase sigma factor [Streptomyces sp. NPDC007088]|uniref:SigE family RNA polymerase sigma factor n=1 Tax=Streptomyces sp. NPDC007088 TaxID=3364773 RepID=UPI003688D7D8